MLILHDLDTKGIEQLYQSQFRTLMQLSALITGDEHMAFEVVQEVFATLLQKKEPVDNLRAYVFTSVRNRSISAMKDGQRWISLDVALEADLEIEESITTETPSIQDIAEAIASLPVRRKHVFLLSRESGLKYAEIADVLGISVKTVENQMMAALRHLRKFLKNE